MIEDVVISEIKADGTVSGMLSAFSGEPSVFNEAAPENAAFPYIIVRVVKYPVSDYVLDGFDIFVHIHTRGRSRVQARDIGERIEFIFDPKIFQNDRYADIRFYRKGDSFLTENDPLQIHYVKQLSARASRKKWMAQL